MLISKEATMPRLRVFSGCDRMTVIIKGWYPHNISQGQNKDLCINTSLHSHGSLQLLTSIRFEILRVLTSVGNCIINLLMFLEYVGNFLVVLQRPLEAFLSLFFVYIFSGKSCQYLSLSCHTLLAFYRSWQFWSWLCV